MNKVDVAVTRLHSEDLPLPKYMSDKAAGMDLYAAVDELVTVPVGDIMAISTGIAIALPDGFEAQIRPRSGLALKKGITMTNSPGTIDADYRGEIKVILHNLGKEPFLIERGDRIAQMVIAPVVQAEWNVVDDLEETVRGSGGFGHTGV